MKNKTSITFTKGEVTVLAHLTRHFYDYMSGDDRLDHGLNKLKGYREINLYHIDNKSFGEPRPQLIEDLISAMGKLNRRWRKMQ
jgi:hypothetical protein